jgi:D-sedoheptulose 7-phosphate isomerase
MSTTLAGTALERRLVANRAYFDARAEPIAHCCRELAQRFADGGRLLAAGASAADRSDARHVAVEFVHPVIVGKRALPALSVDPAALSLLARPQDIVMGFGADLEAVRALGCLAIDFGVPDPDPFVAQELVETHYHVLWELVHVFFEHRGLLEGRAERRVHDTGASSFLYPFLAEDEHDLEGVIDDVRRSALLKSAEVGELRAQTLTDNRDELLAAAAGLRHDFDGGGQLLALGNGGSATDAMDAVADFRIPPDPAWPARRAIDLTEDPAILTAIANDIGTEAIFARQVIAYGSAGDCLLALSTSGNSANVIAALAEARRRELRTIALVGYDGGRVAAERLADHVIVTRSEHIPRIQEAQASAYHLLRELVELAA